MTNNLGHYEYYERRILACGRYLYRDIPNLQVIQLRITVYDREDDSEVIYGIRHVAVLVQPGGSEGSLLEEGPQCNNNDKIKALPGLLKVMQDKVRKAVFGERKFYEQ